MMQEFTALDGAILIDKPSGPTSHDVVDAIRRQFGIKKVGHCGTLDPNATGLLIIVLGRGTKLSERLMSDDKVYEGTIRFGETTDSYDADGELTASMPVLPMTLDELNEAADQFVGDQMQTPPMVSASFAAYLGNTLRYDVDLGSGIVFKADIRDPLHHEQRPMGSAVDLRFAAASAVAIPAA